MVQCDGNVLSGKNKVAGHITIGRLKIPENARAVQRESINIETVYSHRTVGSTIKQLRTAQRELPHVDRIEFSFSVGSS